MKVEIKRRPWIKRLARSPKTFMQHYREARKILARRPAMRLAFSLTLITLK